MQWQWLNFSIFIIIIYPATIYNNSHPVSIYYEAFSVHQYNEQYVRNLLLKPLGVNSSKKELKLAHRIKTEKTTRLHFCETQEYQQSDYT